MTRLKTTRQHRGGAVERNPHFGPYADAVGRVAAVEEFTRGRDRVAVTTPRTACPTCDEPMWWAPVVRALRCPACLPAPEPQLSAAGSATYGP